MLRGLQLGTFSLETRGTGEKEDEYMESKQ